jgi:transcriptional regulator with XRE-family HTH domain
VSRSEEIYVSVVTIRRAAGVSLRELGDACGASAMSVCRWERGQYQPSDTSKLQRYAAALSRMARDIPTF